MFRSLHLPPELPYKHVQWIAPASIDEPIQEYVQRLKSQIEDPHPILVGLSFGGVVATELAKILKPRKLVIIASLATSKALPWHYRLLGSLHLHRYLPLKLMQSMVPLAPWFFGAHTPEAKKLLREIILEIDEKFLRWSMGQLLAWRQPIPFPGVIHIHGTKDKVLPFRKWPNVISIKNGEHLIVLHQAEEVSAILSQLITAPAYEPQK